MSKKKYLEPTKDRKPRVYYLVLVYKINYNSINVLFNVTCIINY